MVVHVIHVPGYLLRIVAVTRAVLDVLIQKLNMSLIMVHAIAKRVSKITLATVVSLERKVGRARVIAQVVRGAPVGRLRVPAAAVVAASRMVRAQPLVLVHGVVGSKMVPNTVVRTVSIPMKILTQIMIMIIVQIMSMIQKM